MEEKSKIISLKTKLKNFFNCFFIKKKIYNKNITNINKNKI